MSVEPIGVATILIGLLCLWLGRGATALAFVLATLFGSAAAIVIGFNNIQPAHLFLAFLAVSTLLNPQAAPSAMAAVSPFKPGFWLVCFAAYGALTAFLFPRLFEGGAEIIALGVSEHGETSSTVPLGPVSSNVTQTIYMIGNLVCFVLIAANASRVAAFNAIATALIAFAGANVVFALLDLATYATGTQGLLDFMRNAHYTMHHQEQMAGLKRIVGSFTETSSFAHVTLGAAAFTGTLWMCGRRPVLTGGLALASIVLLLISTSSTGLAGVLIVLGLLYATALWLGIFKARRISAVTALMAPLISAVLVLVVLGHKEASAAIGYYFDTVVLNKFDSSSGIERSSWNAIALRNFFDTWGLGVGLGTARTSSLLFALLSNVGVIGLALYGLFAGAVLLRPAPLGHTVSAHAADVRLAARNACIALTVADLLAASTVDQGLLFFIFAAIAVSYPSGEVRTYSVRDPKRAPA